MALSAKANLPRISCTRIKVLLVRLIRGKSFLHSLQMGQDFPRGVLVQPEASSRPNSRERSSELASDKAVRELISYEYALSAGSPVDARSMWSRTSRGAYS